jgi:uncharacterized OB-fold protein
VCPACGSRIVEWFTASGRATLYSYVINHRPAPGFEDDAPYAIAVVELDEGPRMMTSIVGLPATPEALQLDMPLQVRFEPRGDVSLPVFGTCAMTGAVELSSRARPRPTGSAGCRTIPPCSCT